MRPIVVGRGQIKTMADVYKFLRPGMTVRIPSGIYNEQLLLASGVRFELDPGAVIDYGADDWFPTVTVGGQQVLNCTVTGGTIKRSGSSGSAGVVITNNSNVRIESTIIVETKSYPIGIEVLNGTLIYNGTIRSNGPCLHIKGGNVVANGKFTSIDDYCLWVSNDNPYAEVRGEVYSVKNSAIQLAAGHLTFEGRAISEGLFGLEMSGGNGIFRNSYFESKKDGGKEVGDAISKYSGEELVLDNCVMKCLNPDAFSIAEQGRTMSVTLASDCRANRTVSPLITLTGAGQLIVEETI